MWQVSPMRCGEREVMVFPGFKAGSIQLVDLYTTEQRVSSAPVTITVQLLRRDDTIAIIVFFVTDLRRSVVGQFVSVVTIALLVVPIGIQVAEYGNGDRTIEPINRS